MEEKVMLTSELAKQIRTMRTESGWPAYWVAEKIGVSNPTYSRLENAEAKTISRSTLTKLGKVFGTRIMVEADDKRELLKRIRMLEQENSRLRTLLEQHHNKDGT